MKIGKLKNKELLKQGQEMETINQKFDEFELQESQYLSNLKKKLIEICDDLEIERSSDELQDISTALFRNGKNKKGVIARTLVLVSEDQELANLSDFRVNLCTYYDRQDELKNIYRNLSLSDDVQNHEKLVKLADIYQEVKEMFNKVVNTITSLETAISIREQYTSNLHNEYGKLFLDGYGISSLGSRERIKEFFNIDIEQV